MKVQKIADGAFFVPPYFSRNVQTIVPGLVNQGIATEELECKDESLEYEDELTKEEFERVLRKIALPLKKGGREKK